MLNTTDKLKIVEYLPEIKSLFYKKIQDENDRLTQKQFDNFVQTDEFKNKKMKLNTKLKEHQKNLKMIKAHLGQTGMIACQIIKKFDIDINNIEYYSTHTNDFPVHIVDKILKLENFRHSKRYGILKQPIEKIREMYKNLFKNLYNENIHFIQMSDEIMNFCYDYKIYNHDNYFYYDNHNYNIRQVHTDPLFNSDNEFPDQLILENMIYRTDKSKLINTDLSWELFLIDLLKLETVEEIDQLLTQNLPELKSLRENIY